MTVNYTSRFDQTVQIKPRAMTFAFERIEDKNIANNNILLSALVASLSALFPPGEAEFIESVRLYRDDITDKDLLERVRGFIGQEGHHSLQHKRANQHLSTIGFDVVSLEKRLEKYIRRISASNYGRSRKLRLASTVGMEHLTAILADFLLRNSESFAQSDDTFKELLMWHAVEEIEHKAVAFDVYMQCVGDQRFLHRVLRFSIMVFIYHASVGTVKLLWQSRRIPSWSDFKGFYNFMLGKDGIVTTLRKPYEEFFQMGFHPWDQDNKDLIDKWKQGFYRAQHDRSSEQFELTATANVVSA